MTAVGVMQDAALTRGLLRYSLCGRPQAVEGQAAINHPPFPACFHHGNLSSSPTKLLQGIQELHITDIGLLITTGSFEV
jgi:hypothetical protein